MTRNNGYFSPKKKGEKGQRFVDSIREKNNE
jgi:hypothetical protein